MHIHPWAKSKQSPQKWSTVDWLSQQRKKKIDQLRRKLTKAQTGNENWSKVPRGEERNENKTNKYVESKGKKEKKE